MCSARGCRWWPWLGLLLACRGPLEVPTDPGPFAPSFVLGPIWDDGQAELASYRVELDEVEGPEFSLGTIVVKQAYDPARESKAEGPGIDAFKWIVHFRRSVGLEELHHAHVANLARPSLLVLKSSHTSFDGCSNRYQEVVRRGSRLESLERSDDYGNAEGQSSQVTAHPIAALPLLVRGLDFGRLTSAELTLVADDGRTTRTMITKSARVPMTQGDQEFSVDELRVTFDPPRQLPWGDGPTGAEVYWVGDGPERPLYGWRDAGGGYRIVRERLRRAAYWEVVPRPKSIDAPPDASPMDPR
jgi:hypothetical protein